MNNAPQCKRPDFEKAKERVWAVTELMRKGIQYSKALAIAGITQAEMQCALSAVFRLEKDKLMALTG